jgi:hypothetical protein
LTVYVGAEVAADALVGAVTVTATAGVSADAGTARIASRSASGGT